MSENLANGLGGKLRHLIDLLDNDVQAVYQSHALDYRPRFTPHMKALIQQRPLSVKALAAAAGQSHSATSQTISAMKRADLVTSALGIDGRMQMIDLTPKALGMIHDLQRCWAATDAAAQHLDQELTHSLALAVTEAISALQAAPFKSRIEAQQKSHDESPESGARS